MAQFVWRKALAERGKVNKRKRKCTCGSRESGLSIRPSGKLALNRDRKTFSFCIITFDIRALVGGEKGGLTIRLTGKLVNRP